MIYLGNQAVGVASWPCGEFTKHEQIKATPSSSSVFTLSHTLGEKPKLVTVTCSETSTPYTEEGYMRETVLYKHGGGCWYHNGANHNVVVGGFVRSSLDTIPAASNGYYAFGTDQISIYRISANGVWNTSTENTFDLYA